MAIFMENNTKSQVLMWLLAPIDLDPYFGYHCIDTCFHPSLLVKKFHPPKILIPTLIMKGIQQLFDI